MATSLWVSLLNKRILMAKNNNVVLAKNRKMNTILIHKTEGDTGTDDVQVSVNARVFIIKRGVEVEVPDFVVEALNNAIITKYRFVNEGEDLQVRDVHSYPFSVLA